MSNTTNILAFAASNSRSSINKMLVTHAAHVLKDEINTDAQVTVLDLNDFEMPIYSVDREAESGIPEQATAFYEAIGQADALLISYAEYNGSYTSAFKNIFDWCSRISMKVFQEKPTVVLSTSPGKNGGAGVMKTALEAAPYFGADIRGSLAIGSFNDVFDKDTAQLTDPAIASALRVQLKLLS